MFSQFQQSYNKKSKTSFSNIYGNSIKQNQPLEKHYSFQNTKEE